MKKNHWVSINQNLCVDNLRTSIQEDIGWIPDLRHNQTWLMGSQILKNIAIREGDSIEVGKNEEPDLMIQPAWK